MQGHVFEKAEFEADADYLHGVVRAADVVARSAEAGQRVVGTTGEFDAGLDEGGVELDDGLELNFEAELHTGRGRGLALEHPASALREGRGEGGQETLTVLI